ncbi:MAG TPA: GspE/PulE family protein [Candidatus Paceibacterota bacterium]|nr:GspE/PulE family protein [Candidatus Paceibacterota bacterium]
MNFLRLLVDNGTLSVKDRAEVEADLAKKRSLEDALNAHGVVLAKALADVGATYGLPTRLLGDPPANSDVFDYIPIESAQHYGFVPIDVQDGVLEVGVTDPDNLEAIDALQFISGKIGIPYKIFLITMSDFDRVVAAYENISGEVNEALSEYETTKVPAPGESPAIISPLKNKESSEEDLNLTGVSGTFKEDAPVTKIVSTILRYAIEGHSSDIHIEPSATKTRVRFRMDGNLHTSIELPGKVHEAVIARIKILAKLRLDEKRKPQDGRFSATVEKRRIDFRVSTFPTEYGEKIVMRILDQSAATATLDSVGLTKENLATVREMMKAPYGIILIAGPTGSGKSTTLFAMLSELDREKFNVVSLEDPVEYEIPGVAQSQVRPEIGYTFANGLRSILRQDPDIIMVGEIRDKETAVLAVQAALTGHLVFTTIHTNTAAGAVSRLIDMGVDPFLIAPTLVGVIGQRLARKLCDGAGVAFPVSVSLQGFIDREFADLPEKYRAKLPPMKEFYHVTPTAECPNGTRGRTGIFEILRMNKKLEEVILTEPVEEKIYAVARSEGMLTMREDAILKVLDKEISFEEINALGGELFPDENTVDSGT